MPKAKNKARSSKAKVAAKAKQARRYDEIGPVHGGLRTARDENKWLYIRNNGEPAFGADRYDEASDFVFEHGQWLAWVRVDGESYQINTHGARVD